MTVKNFNESSNKKEFWTAAVELFLQSGLSCMEFCNREGLSYSTFCRWRDKLMSKQNTKAALPDLNSEAKRNSVESDDDKSEEVKFASAGVIGASGDLAAGIEVRFSSGVSINVCKGFDTDTFKEVVSILEAQLC